VIAAAGNLEHQQLVDLVIKYLDSVPLAQNPNQQVLPVEKPQQRVIENNFQQAHLCLGRRIFAYSDLRRYPLLVLNTILGYGMSSRLFQSIREKYGLAYSIYSFTDFMQDTGIFGVYLSTDREKLELAIDLAKKELKTLSKVPIPSEEIQKRKNQLKGNILLGLESTSHRMNRLAKNEIYYSRFIPIETIINAIEKVKQEQITELAASLFVDEQMSTMILKPVK